MKDGISREKLIVHDLDYIHHPQRNYIISVKNAYIVFIQYFNKGRFIKNEANCSSILIKIQTIIYQ